MRLWVRREPYPRARTAERLTLSICLLMRAAVGGIAGEAARAVEEGEGAIRVVVDAHLRPDVVRPERAGWNLQPAAVLSLPTTRSSWMLRMSARIAGSTATKADPSCSAGWAKRALWAGR